jgi:DNA-binding beta-propeller fold protein YncE
MKTMIEMQPDVGEVAYNLIRTPGRLETQLTQNVKHKIYVLVTLALLGLPLVLAPSAGSAQQAGGTLFVLESKITLGAVNGRIDHLAFDVSRKQVFIAELENNTVGVVDLGGARLLHRISALNAPQGVGYVPSADALFVANGRDGTVRVFKGGEFSPVGRLMLGSDADNVRVDTETSRVIVGYGSGALATIDLTTRTKIKDIALAAHPESFQISARARQIFVNLPDTQSIIVVDRDTGAQIASWSTGEDRGNFAMALDEENKRVLVVFRNPPKLSARDMRTGAVVAERDTCGDVDDVFVDEKRRRVYVTCGEGFIDVLNASADYARLARTTTRPGARTSLFIPPLDRLAVAARASGSEPAELWIYRATP